MSVILRSQIFKLKFSKKAEWKLIYRTIPLVWILDSKAQDFIFYEQKFSGFQIPDFYIEQARC